MEVRETKNIQDIKRVLCDPEIYNCITDDYCGSVEDFEPPITNDYRYIVGYVKDEPIGVMVYHSYRDGEECHVQVLPKFRKKYAKQFGEQVLNHKDTRPLYAEIPDLYANVLAFAKLNGFKVIENIENSYLKNGKKYDIKVLLWDSLDV